MNTTHPKTVTALRTGPRRPKPKPWAHRHILQPLYERRGNNPEALIGFQCRGIHCDELFTRSGNVSQPYPDGDMRRSGPLKKLFRKGENHKARVRAHARLMKEEASTL